MILYSCNCCCNHNVCPVLNPVFPLAINNIIRYIIHLLEFYYLVSPSRTVVPNLFITTDQSMLGFVHCLYCKYINKHKSTVSLYTTLLAAFLQSYLKIFSKWKIVQTQLINTTKIINDFFCSPVPIVPRA